MKKGPVKIVVLVVALLVVVGGTFWGGMAYQKAKLTSSMAAGPGALGSGRMGSGDTSMTPPGDTSGSASGLTSRIGGTVEGEVLDVADDSITVAIDDSSSTTCYINSDTVIAYVQGAAALAEGSEVMIIASPTTDDITTATLVVVM